MVGAIRRGWPAPDLRCQLRLRCATRFEVYRHAVVCVTAVNVLSVVS